MFLYGFAKREQDNIDPDELLTLREIAGKWLAADAKRVVQALSDGVLQEVTYDEKKKVSRLIKALLETANARGFANAELPVYCLNRRPRRWLRFSLPGRFVSSIGSLQKICLRGSS